MKPSWIAFLLIFACAGSVFAGDPTPKDFAYGMRLATAGGEALYEVTLPLDAYRGVVRGDLGDLCVLNGRNEVVPFTVVRPAPGPAGKPETVSLPIFPLMAEPGRKADTLSLQVKKDKSGSIINVTAGDGKGTKREIIAYIIDASRIDRAVSALEPEPANTEEGFVCTISVQESNDLEHWTYTVRDASIVRLRYGEHTLERNVIELDGSKARYYRISSPDSGEMPELKGISAKLAPIAPEPPRRWISVPSAIKKKDGYFEYAFDSGGHMPIDRIRARLPQDNTLVNAVFLSRPSTADNWSPRGSSLVFRVRLRGSDMRSPDVSFPPVTDRYWVMRIDRTGGGLGQGAPGLALGWVPEKVLFVARGSGPFTLAYGSSRLRVGGENGNDLLTEFKNLRKENIVAKAVEAGPQFILGGSAALRPGMTPQDWKTAILWAVLVLGVALLAWMAIRLYRQMN
jgi:hypothetical protein